MNKHVTSSWTQFAFFGGYILLLVTLPRWIPPASDVFSAAAVEGYNTSVAHLSVLIWSIAGLVFFARNNSAEHLHAPQRNEELGSLIWWELAVVAVLFSAAFFPEFLASYAPYGEDQYFLAALHRMSCGQVPFKDFEFLYGPLMLYPIWEWMKVFGVSATSYFGMLSVAEGLTFAVVLAVLQLFIRDRRYRWLAFLILLPFLFNTLLGFSYNGLRKLVPIFAVFMVAHRPFDIRNQMAASILLGLHLAYSLEYAIAGIAAMTGMYALCFFAGERGRVIKALLLLGSSTALVWALAILVMVGSSLGDYVSATFRILDVMSSGHAAFPFYWTLNSLALFGLLALSCIVVGSGLSRLRTKDIGTGDRLFLAAIIYALVLLKSGLTRADLWHLIGPFLFLIFVFLTVKSGNCFRVSNRQRQIAMVLLVIGSLTHLVGVAPTGSLYAAGYVRGALDYVAGSPEKVRVRARATIFETERSEPREEYIELAEYLASSEKQSKPVLFYGRTWHMGPVIGVCKTQFPLDDIMYNERTEPAVAFLEQNPDSLIVMEKRAFARLFQGDDEVPEFDLTLTKKIGRILSTIHYDYRETEWNLQNAARDAATGRYVSERYEIDAEFGDVVLLRPINTPAE